MSSPSTVPRSHLPDPDDRKPGPATSKTFVSPRTPAWSGLPATSPTFAVIPSCPPQSPAISSMRFPPRHPSRARASTPSSTISADQILPAVTQWNHPGFMAYFGTSASTPGILAELLIAAMNTNGLHWKTSPAVAELEQVALGWLRQWLGLPPEFFGIIYDTASTSTMHALICAREFAQPESRDRAIAATSSSTPPSRRTPRSRRAPWPSASARRTCARCQPTPSSA